MDEDNSDSHRFTIQCFRLKVSPDEEVKRCLQMLTQTKELSLPNKWLKTQQWSAFFKVLSSSASSDIKTLNLSYTNLQTKSLKGLATLLSSGGSCSDLKRLDLSGIDFHFKRGLGDIVRCIDDGDCCVKHLELKDCKLQDKDLWKIFFQSVTDAGNTTIVPSSSNTTLTNLNLCSNKINGHGNLFRRLIYHFTTLCSLDLSWNHINHTGARSLACALSGNNNLKCLNLSFNGVSDEGALEMAFMLEQNNTLEVLDIRENRITNKGAEYLASGLAVNTSLRSLNLSGNMITSLGMQRILVGVITSGCVIRELHMKQISPDVLCMKAIQHLEEKNVHLSYGIPTLTKTNTFKGDSAFIVREEIFSEIRNFLAKERLRIIDLFKMWDKRKTGEISLDNLMTGLASCGIPVTQAILEHIFGVLDENENNSLSYSEFLRIAKI